MVPGAHTPSTLSRRPPRTLSAVDGLSSKESSGLGAAGSNARSGIVGWAGGLALWGDARSDAYARMHGCVPSLRRTGFHREPCYLSLSTDIALKPNGRLVTSTAATGTGIVGGPVVFGDPLPDAGRRGSPFRRMHPSRGSPRVVTISLTGPVIESTR